MSLLTGSTSKTPTAAEASSPFSLESCSGSDHESRMNLAWRMGEGMILVGLLGLISTSCSKESPPPSTPGSADLCYRSIHSVLLGPPTTTGQQGVAPGWVQLSG